MTWQFQGQSGGEDGTVRRPFLPVQFRLVGTRNSVAAYLNMLDGFFELYDVSEPGQARHGQIRVYGTLHRLYPIRGGDYI